MAAQSDNRRGWVKDQPIRYVHNHHGRLSGVRVILDPVTGCHIWQGSTDGNGYGRIRVDGKTKPAHVHFYEQKYGPMPEGMLGCHTCDNPPCCNPDHIFPGTHQDNVDDAIAKGRRKRKAVAA